MKADVDSFAAARERVELAYNPELLRAVGARLVDQLADHLKNVETSQGKVLNWALPIDNVADARRMADASEASSDRGRLAERFAHIVNEMLSRGHNLHDPRYMGHQVPAPVPLAGLFDAVGSVTNQVMAVYEMGPWATAVEQAMVAELGRYIGWQDGAFAGLATHGGTLANLNAILVARNLALKDCWEHGMGGIALERPADSDATPPVLVVQADAHYSIARAAGVLGIGNKNVVKVGLDARRRMDVRQLDDTLTKLKSKGHPMIAVVACAGSTAVGAFDPLGAVADVCQRHGVWFHVDAAHGGSALLSERHRHLVAGIERADSIVWDAHKMMFVPALCAFVFFKDRRHSYASFQQSASYLFDPNEPGIAEFDMGLRTFECTKRAAVYGLWGVWSMFGPRLFSDMVDVTFELGRVFHQKLTAAPDFVPLNDPEANILVFRHVPAELADASPRRLGEFQRQLRRRVIESGDFYLVAINLNGVDALRTTLINPLTTAEHLDALLERLRREGREMLAAR